MTAVVYQIRDFQSKKDLERMRQALEKEAAEIMKEVVPLGLPSADGAVTYVGSIAWQEERAKFSAPENDPA